MEPGSCFFQQQFEDLCCADPMGQRGAEGWTVTEAAAQPLGLAHMQSQKAECIERWAMKLQEKMYHGPYEKLI